MPERARPSQAFERFAAKWRVLLTDLGRTLEEPLAAICGWALRNPVRGARPVPAG